MDLRRNCLELALNTILSAGLVTPAEPEDLCARLNEAGFPNLLIARPMTGNVTGYCERDDTGRYLLMYDALGTREQQRRDICHEVTHMVGGHALTGLICARADALDDIREREAETTAEWFIVLLSLADLSRYATNDFRLLMEQLNGARTARRRRWSMQKGLWRW